ncbi:MAG: sodium:solute symporter family protein [Gammaproteobacteria bacterium]|jgi:SSS family solute:Na+ symporter
MSDSSIALSVCFAYLAVVLVVGILPGLRMRPSVAGFVAGDRQMDVLLLYFVLGAAIFSSFAFLGGPGWAYSRGGAAYFILAYGALGLLPMYFIGPKTRRVGERFGFVTQAELLAHRFDSGFLSVLLAVLSIVAFIPYLTLQMTGAGYILETVSNGSIPLWVGAGLAYGVVTLYVLFSGVLGVGWTSMFQGMMMMAIAWGLGLYLPWKLYGGIGAMFERLAATGHGAMLAAPGLGADGHPWSWWAFASAIAVSALGFSCWPHFFMKAFAARDDRSLKLMVVFYPTFQIFLIPILIVGFAGILAFPGVKPADTILPYILTHVALSPVIVGLVCVGTLAASMSSGDAILHAAGSIGIRDGLGRFLDRRLDDRTETRLIRLLTLAVAGTAYYFAVSSQVSLVALLLASYGGVAQIFPVVIATFYWRGATRPGVLAGLIAGLVVNTLFLVWPEFKPLPMHEGVYGLLANVALLTIVSRMTTPPAADTVGEYVSARWD